MRPRSSCLRVASSRSLANCANAASSRYCASARRTPPPVSRRFMTFVCAAPPTRDTEMPALMAGRIPALKRSVSRKIWPSVIEMTLVGTNAVTSPAWVSMTGKAVSDPVLPLTAPLRSEERRVGKECRHTRWTGDWSSDVCSSDLAADPRYRDAGVDGGADTGVEEVGLEEDLAVGDRNDVGRNERGDVARLGLDDRQGGKRSGLALDRALEIGRASCRERV